MRLLSVLAASSQQLARRVVVRIALACARAVSALRGEGRWFQVSDADL